MLPHSVWSFLSAENERPHGGNKKLKAIHFLIWTFSEEPLLTVLGGGKSRGRGHWKTINVFCLNNSIKAVNGINVQNIQTKGVSEYTSFAGLGQYRYQRLHH